MGALSARQGPVHGAPTGARLIGQEPRCGGARFWCQECKTEGGHVSEGPWPHARVCGAKLVKNAAAWLSQNEADIYPDFVGMAKSFGVASRRVIRKDELRGAVREMLDTPGPYLLEVRAPLTPRQYS